MRACVEAFAYLKSCVTDACPGISLVKRYRLESMQSDILDANLQRDDFPITVVAEAAELNRCSEAGAVQRQ
eukprot:1161571-Pelagomonas_calceolata.AAC.1